MFLSSTSTTSKQPENRVWAGSSPDYGIGVPLEDKVLIWCAIADFEQRFNLVICAVGGHFK